MPVVQAAKNLHIPVIIHESDMTPGLANRLAIPAASKVCCNFPETISHLPEGKAVVTGCPIRSELRSGSRLAALNNAVRSILPQLLQKFQIIHLCGKGNIDESFAGTPGYVQYEYIKQELADLFALADVVVSRAGANAICELLELRKPALLIPLSAAASRGDQILNAKSFKKQGFSDMLEEEQITPDLLLEKITSLFDNRQTYITAMEKSSSSDAVSTIVSLIETTISK